MPKRAPPSSVPPRGPRARSALTGQDMDAAQRDALLQLKIGRSAHLLTVAVSALLGLDAVLLLFFFSPLPTLSSGEHGLSGLLPTVYLLLPLVGAILLATVGVAAKWGEFRFWPWERHFLASLGSLALGLFAGVLYVGRLTGIGPWASAALFPWLIVLTLTTVTFALLGLSLTWRPWDGRHWASALAALLPLAVVSILFFAPSQTGSGSEPLTVTLLLSAVLYQTSGSFLHLVSSGTQAHRDALVLSGQTRLGRLADEVHQKEEALRFRELAVLRREAEAETAETTARRHQDNVTRSRERLESLDAEMRQRGDTLAQKERELAGRVEETEGRRRLLDDRDRTLSVKARELDQVVVGLNERAQQLARHEGEQAQRDVELAQTLTEIERREGQLADLDQRLAARDEQIEQKTTEILRREGEVAAREQAVGGSDRASRAGPSVLEQELAGREARSRHLKTLLDQQGAQLGQRAQELATQARSAEVARRKVAERQAALAAREAALLQKESDLTARAQEAERQQAELEKSAGEYRRRLEEVGAQRAEIARRSVDVDRSLRSLPDRENELARREARLAAGLAELERRESTVLARERAVESDEVEAALNRSVPSRARRSASGRTGGTGELDRSAPGIAGATLSGDTPVGPPPEGRAPTAGETMPVADTLAPAPVRRYSDRLPSGTPRLDDLLLGGFPPRSQVALVGDAFVGKEVALYAFVAEGLRRNESVVLVTATRSPEEVADNLGLLLPQFREYEQRGRVTWVDASGSSASPTARRLVPGGVDDLPGLLSAVARASKECAETTPGPFRVAFLGLSAVLAHGDERAGFSFLQNVVGLLKPQAAVALYSLEAGALSEAQAESLLTRMDGAILFRQDRDRTFLSVKGFGDVQTRDWVECRATNRALVVGSFALERIR